MKLVEGGAEHPAERLGSCNSLGSLITLCVCVHSHVQPFVTLWGFDI